MCRPSRSEVCTDIGQTRTLAAEIEAKAELTQGFTVDLVATLQDSKYTDFIRNVPGIGDLDLSGNTPAKVPEVIVAVTPQYIRRGFTAYASMRYFGKRFGTDRNILEYQSYTEFSAGFFYHFGAIELSGQVFNISDVLAPQRGAATDINSSTLDDPVGTIQKASFS